MARKYVLDKSWAGHAFLAPPSSLSDSVDNNRRFRTSSSRKFIDTTMGGHWAINPLSQFTENCDISHPSIFSRAEPMGRWFSEVLDDNAQLVHIRCGVPQFNSLTNFFGNFYNIHAGSMARTGRAPDLWFSIGKVAGFIGTLPLQPFILAGSMFKFFVGMPRSKYYYLKPAMYSYWLAYSGFVNGMFVNMGLSPHFTNDAQKRYFDPLTIPGTADIGSMNRVLNDGIVMTDGGIDVFRMSTKAQRLANRYRERMDDALSNMTGDPAKRADEFSRILYDGVDNSLMDLDDPGASLADYESAYLAFLGQYNEKDSYNSEKYPDENDDKGWWTKAGNAYTSERHMGADFVTLRVNFTPTNSESFNNQTTEPSIKTEINAMSSKARMARFNLADGNVAGFVGKAVEVVSNVAKGILESAQLEGLVALAGNSFADIQKMYESSSADLNRTTFTIPLRSWAGDDWVRLKNLMIPLGGILAMSLPRATGMASYDGPPLLEVFNQGHTLIREGMVESLTIERGVGDVGWKRGGQVLGIDVHITIVDLSTIMSMPINPAFSGLSGALTAGAELVAGDAGVTAASALNKSTYSEDNKWTDYLATLGGLPLNTMINSTRKWQLNMAQSRAAYNQWKSPDRVVSGLMNSLPGDIIKAVSRPTDRP